MGSIRRAAACLLAIVLTSAVGLVAVSGASTKYGADVPPVGPHFIKFVSAKCFSDGITMQVVLKDSMGTIPNKRNNLRSMSLQARLIPADSGDINYYYAWGRTATDSVVSEDGVNRTLFTVKTPSEALGDYDLQVKAKWDRFATKDWNLKSRGPFNEGFCEGGTFPGRPFDGNGSWLGI